MIINMYVINAALILLVIRQIREHSLDLRSLAPRCSPSAPPPPCSCLRSHSAATTPRWSWRAAAGAAMGAIGGPATRLRLGADGQRGGVLAASMWVGRVGARLAFAIAVSYGGPAIARFSAAHQITGLSAWVAALVMMAPGRRAHPAGRRLPCAGAV
jgi:hypothetical protein